MQRTQGEKVGRATTFIWILLLPLIFGFFGLQNSDTAQNYTKLNTFFILYIGSLIALIAVTVTMLKRGSHLDDLELFWTLDIDKNGLKWIGIGIIFVLLSVAILLGIGSSLSGDGLQNAQMGGIFVAGLIMMFAFLKTNAILVPVFIHGTYNSLVTFLQKMPFDVTHVTPEQLSVLPEIPKIGVGILGQAADLYSEMIWQFTIVAVAEEFLKLTTLVAVVWVIHGIWKRESLSILFGVIISVVLWVVLHQVRG